MGSIQRSIHGGARHRLPSSAWNHVVIENLANWVVKKLQENQSLLFPNKSRKYWEAMLHDKFIHIKSGWACTQPWMMKSGHIEVANEVEECKCKYIDRKLKMARV